MDLDGLIVSSPLSVFRGMLDEVTQELDGASHVDEWVGPGRHLPVFDVQPLRDFAGAAANRERLAQLLASYVRVASGSVWERSGGRWRRRRYSELDPLSLAELGAFRRLGDLALFLSGVFPDYTAAHPLRPLELHRIASLIGSQPGELARSKEPFWLMEWVGRSAYSRAGDRSDAERFGTARRLLNVLTVRHLFPVREHWFPGLG